MNTIEFFPYHNRHIRFFTSKSDEEFSGIIFDKPWEEKQGQSSSYYFLPSANISLYKSLEWQDKSKQKSLLQTIDITDIRRVSFYASELSASELENLEEEVKERLSFFSSRYNELGRENETFAEYLLRFEEESINKFKIVTETVSQLAQKYNSAFSNPNTSASRSLGYTFKLSEYNNVTFPQRGKNNYPFVLLQLNEKKVDIPSDSKPFLQYYCNPKVGIVSVLMKSNHYNSAIVQIDSFEIYDGFDVARIEVSLLRFLQTVVKREYA